MKRIVECKVPFVREVRIGIDADTEEEAVRIARELMESPDLPLDNPIFPVLRDALEETGGPESCQVVEVLTDDQDCPLPDSSVSALRRRVEATRAARLLVQALSGSEPDEDLLDAAYAAALRATGRNDGTGPTRNRIAIITEGGAIQAVVAEDPHAIQVIEIDYTRSAVGGRPPILEHPVEESALEMEELFDQARAASRNVA